MHQKIRCSVLTSHGLRSKEVPANVQSDCIKHLRLCQVSFRSSGLHCRSKRLTVVTKQRLIRPCWSLLISYLFHRVFFGCFGYPNQLLFVSISIHASICAVIHPIRMSRLVLSLWRSWVAIGQQPRLKDWRFQWWLFISLDKHNSIRFQLVRRWRSKTRWVPQ